ncbi:DNA-3-methyladenine glycosylase 2 family protein [Halomonas sediminis]
MHTVAIERGMQALVLADPDIARTYPLVGAPSPRQRDPGFATFFSTIVSQQISTQAARAIMGRVKLLIPEISTSAVLEVDGQALRDAGLSWRKVEYVKGLADAVHTKVFDAEELDILNDDEVIAAITQLRGFGRWSAEIYLIFSLKRTDIFPADDLALRVALGRLKGMDDKPTPQQARQLVEHWAPWRSVGSLFLWHYYHGEPL